MIQIGNSTFSSPLINSAAPFCKTLSDVKSLCRTNIGGVLVGSYTVEKRTGNKGENKVALPGGSYINSMGLPNFGMEKLIVELPKMVKVVRRAGKVLIVSVAATKHADDYVDLALTSFDKGADLVELNFGCPNVWEGKKQKRILSYDIQSMVGVLEKLKTHLKEKQFVIVKLSPLGDPQLIREFCKMIGQYEFIAAVCSVNTFPNSRYFDKTFGPLSATNGYGGYSGEGIFPISLGQASQLRDNLPKKIKIIGVGGISNGERLSAMLEFADIGACATIVMREGTGAFNRILSEYATLQ